MPRLGTLRVLLWRPIYAPSRIHNSREMVFSNRADPSTSSRLYRHDLQQSSRIQLVFSFQGNLDTHTRNFWHDKLAGWWKDRRQGADVVPNIVSPDVPECRKDRIGIWPESFRECKPRFEAAAFAFHLPCNANCYR